MSHFKGRKIPYGATHYGENAELFYKEIDGEWFYYGFDGWELSVSADSLGFESKLTALLIQPIQQPYIPKDGEECKATWGTKEKWFLAMVAGKFLFVKFRDRWDRLLISDLPNVEFRPIKSKAEKQADAIYELVKDAADLHAACGILVEAGYSK